MNRKLKLDIPKLGVFDFELIEFWYVHRQIKEKRFLHLNPLLRNQDMGSNAHDHIFIIAFFFYFFVLSFPVYYQEMPKHHFSLGVFNWRNFYAGWIMQIV